MRAVFVHVSDIHFGQERDHHLQIHDDVKQQLIADAGEVIAGLSSGVAQGILVTGDIAQSGEWAQYESAAKWLDSLADAIGCPIHRVQMVPGNHDIDRSKLSRGGKHLLDYIRAGGAAEYEEVVGNANDRSTLFARFEDYGRFCVGYGCALDEEARFATNLCVELAPGRHLRFIRLNSALLCTGEEGDGAPELVIGSRQFPLPRNAGEENVVLVHHPLSWYKDADDVRTYVRSRARVFISGHEHNPKVEIDHVEDGCDVMMLAAGAAVPFRSSDAYTYTYNIIEFEWDAAADALAVTMHPRTWNARRTCFEADSRPLGGNDPRFTLGSPNFRRGRDVSNYDAAEPPSDAPDAQPAYEVVAAESETEEKPVMPPKVEGYELALLRFFRDLLENERLRILVDLDAIPADSNERMTQGLEKKLFNWLVRTGHLPDVVTMTDKLISERNEGRNDG